MNLNLFYLRKYILILNLFHLKNQVFMIYLINYTTFLVINFNNLSNLNFIYFNLKM